MSRFMLNQDIFKMLHFFNVNLFILLLAGIILPPTCAGSFANDSDSSHRIPLVINTWAGNYEVATNKGDKTLDLTVLEKTTLQLICFPTFPYGFKKAPCYTKLCCSR